MNIDTKGGTSFDVIDEKVFIHIKGRTQCAIPIDDLEEFCERYFTDRSRAFPSFPPPGFEAVKYDGVLSEHHRTFQPRMLKSLANAVEPYWVMCTLCGFKVPGSTPKFAAQNWNQHVHSSESDK